MHEVLHKPKIKIETRIGIDTRYHYFRLFENIFTIYKSST